MYAARQLRAAIDKLGVECSVIGSKPAVPFTRMEDVLGMSVHWVDASKPTTWSILGLPIPDVYFQSGWNCPAFSSLGRQVKATRGVVVGMSDSNWRCNFRQIVLGPAWFRIAQSKHFDAVLVPGEQGKRLMEWYGVKPASIYQGMYGADPNLFQPGPQLTERKNEILFVGQYIIRKDVLGIARAFARIADRFPDWRLRLCGAGELHEMIPRHPQIIMEGFVQPDQLASRFQNARYLALPSLEESWGVVVHEAALCGCALILSDKVGSKDDLACPENSIIFKAGDEHAIRQALVTAIQADDRWLDKAYTTSIKLGARLGPERFTSEVLQIISKFSNRR
jgi:glycosyltransferase involved in cell wall biosynthesis